MSYIENWLRRQGHNRKQSETQADMLPIVAKWQAATTDEERSELQTELLARNVGFFLGALRRLEEHSAILNLHSSIEDAYSEALFELTLALNLYDPKKHKAAFGTFWFYRVRWRLLNPYHMGVKRPARRSNFSIAVRTVKRVMEQQLQADEYADELAAWDEAFKLDPRHLERMGVKRFPKQQRAAMARRFAQLVEIPVSADQPQYEDGSSLADGWAQDYTPKPNPSTKLDRIAGRLSGRDKQIFIGLSKGRTPAAIGDDLGVSGEAIRLWWKGKTLPLCKKIAEGFGYTD